MVMVIKMMIKMIMAAWKIFSMTLTYFKVIMHHDGDGDQNDDSDDYVCLENLFNDSHLLQGDDEQNNVYKIMILMTVLKIF